ncbi:MAG: ABC transporter permease [Clostridia bacterium]|nr:ABC transporter permease [Clostridia bacterium]
MKSFYAGILSETDKIFGRKKTPAILILSTLITLLTWILIYYLKVDTGLWVIQGEDYPIKALGIFAGFILPLFVSMITIDLFSEEYTKGTIKVALLRPIARYKIYLAKIVAVGIYIAANLLLIFITSSIASLFLGVGDHLAASTLQNLAAYIMALFPLLLVAVISSFVSQFFKSGSGALAAMVLIYFILKLSPLLLPALSTFSPLAAFDFYSLWTGSTLSPGNIFLMFMFMLSYYIIFLAPGIYLFDKKDF